MSRSSIESAPLLTSANAGRVKSAKSGSLAVAGSSAILASACCIGPLVLASISLGSFAAGIVAMFEPLRPIFITIALAALGFAGWKIYRRPVVACDSGAACAGLQPDRTHKTVFWVVAAIVLALIAFPYYAALFY